MDRNVTLICLAADRTAAEAIAATYPGGSGTFGVALTSVPNGTVATHYAGSGYVDGDMADAFEISVDPMVKVFDNTGTDFFTIIAGLEPSLYRVVEEL